MSNAVEIELKGLINELQGLYRQCAADIAKLKEESHPKVHQGFINLINSLRKDAQTEIDTARKDLHEAIQGPMNRLTALEEKILPMESDIDELYSKYNNHDGDIDALESDRDILIKEQSEDRQRIKALESAFKEHLKSTIRFNDLDAVNYDIHEYKEDIEKILKQLERYKEEDEWLEGK